jgi:hypothetical protein
MDHEDTETVEKYASRTAAGQASKCAVTAVTEPDLTVASLFTKGARMNTAVLSATGRVCHGSARRVRALCGENFVIEYRISADEFTRRHAFESAQVHRIDQS